MGAMASQITSLTIVYSTVYSGTDQRKHRSSASLAFVRGIHRSPVNSSHKGPVTRKMFPFDDVIVERVLVFHNPKTHPCCSASHTICTPEFALCCDFTVGLHSFIHIPTVTSSNGNISALLTICAGNSPVTGELPVQRPVTRSFDVFFDLRLTKRLSKQSWGWWFETPSGWLWRHRNAQGTSLRLGNHVTALTAH